MVEQVKLDYSPLANVFTKRLGKDDKTEGLFKRLKNLKNKSGEEQLKVFRRANKVSKAAKNESNFHYDSRYAS